MVGHIRTIYGLCKVMGFQVSSRGPSSSSPACPTASWTSYVEAMMRELAGKRVWHGCRMEITFKYICEMLMAEFQKQIQLCRESLLNVQG